MAHLSFYGVFILSWLFPCVLSWHIHYLAHDLHGLSLARSGKAGLEQDGSQKAYKERSFPRLSALPFLLLAFAFAFGPCIRAFSSLTHRPSGHTPR